MKGDKKLLIAISGGIGTGKSVVSNVLHAMGYAVYDTDSGARNLMDSSDDIKRRLWEAFGQEAFMFDDPATINRGRLAQIVFNDKDKLHRLNAIVHAAVIRDVENWRERLDDTVAFVETALLYQSGMDAMVDAVWEITCHESVRVERVMLRNNMTEAEVRARIASQNYAAEKQHPVIYRIVNDGVAAVLPQVLIGLDTVRGILARKGLV